MKRLPLENDRWVAAHGLSWLDFMAACDEAIRLAVWPDAAKLTDLPLSDGYASCAVSDQSVRQAVWQAYWASGQRP